MIVSEIELFEVLSRELGREKAKSLVEYVEHKVLVPSGVSVSSGVPT